MPTWIEVNHRDADGLPMAGQRYKIHFEGGQVISGQLDASGHARHENVPLQGMRVEYEPREPLPDQDSEPLSKLVATAKTKLS